MHDYSARVSDDVVHILTEAKVLVTDFVAKTTQVFHILDLTLFMFSSGVRGMNCRSMTIMGRSYSS
jgi:hypothetical protein